MNMKIRKILLIVLSGWLFLLYACSGAEKGETKSPGNTWGDLLIEHSAKGWEIYSWEEPDGWYYSILVGTNRVKNLEEVKYGNGAGGQMIRIHGMGELEQVLERFPAGENLSWVGEGWLNRAWQGNYGDLGLPPEKIQEEVGAVCSRLGLSLQIAE